MFIIELLNEKNRAYSNLILASGATIGSMLFGIAVMFEHDFRIVLRFFNIPALFVFFYFWFIFESVHWLLATGRIGRAIMNIKRIAKVNRHELSEETIEKITLRYSAKLSDRQKSNENVKNQSVLNLFWTMLKTRTLCLRFLNICYQWIAGKFSVLGLYQYAMQIPGVDRYVSYMIMIGADILGIILVQLLLNRMKRRTLLFSASSLAGIAIIITSFIPKEYPWIVVICFVISKSLLDLSTVVSAIFTTEQFPTRIRTTVLNTAHTCAQIGMMMAPFIVILVRNFIFLIHSILFIYFLTILFSQGTQLNHNIPAFLFGGAAISIAISVILNPETFGKNLPQNIEEAINL